MQLGPDGLPAPNVYYLAFNRKSEFLKEFLFLFDCYSVTLFIVFLPPPEVRSGVFMSFVHCSVPSVWSSAGTEQAPWVYFLADEMASLGFSIALVAVSSPTH